MSAASPEQLAEIRLAIRLELSDFNAKMEKAKKKYSKEMKDMERVNTRMGKSLATLSRWIRRTIVGWATLAVARNVLAATRSADQFATSVLALSKRLELSIEFVQKLNFAAADANINLQTFGTSMQRALRRGQEAFVGRAPNVIRILNELGASFKNVGAGVHTNEKFLFDLLSRLYTAPDVLRLEAFSGIFDVEGTQLAQMDEFLKTYMETTRESGRLLTDEDVIQTDDIRRNIVEIDALMRADLAPINNAWSQFWTAMKRASIPFTQSLHDAFLMMTDPASMGIEGLKQRIELEKASVAAAEAAQAKRMERQAARKRSGVAQPLPGVAESLMAWGLGHVEAFRRDLAETAGETYVEPHTVDAVERAKTELAELEAMLAEAIRIKDIAKAEALKDEAERGRAIYMTGLRRRLSDLLPGHGSKAADKLRMNLSTLREGREEGLLSEWDRANAEMQFISKYEKSLSTAKDKTDKMFKDVGKDMVAGFASSLGRLVSEFEFSFKSIADIIQAALRMGASEISSRLIIKGITTLFPSLGGQSAAPIMPGASFRSVPAPNNAPVNLVVEPARPNDRVEMKAGYGQDGSLRIRAIIEEVGVDSIMGGKMGEAVSSVTGREPRGLRPGGSIS